MTRPTFELFYWPSIQGRGEFVRLALEEGGARYVDVARTPGGMAELTSLMRGGAQGLAPFAPPFLRHGERVIAQTAAILSYLAPRLRLVPKDEASRVYAHQLQLTLADLVAEAHDTHHPIAVTLYYEDQRREARRRAEHFCTERLPKFLGYFEQVIARAGGTRLLGRTPSYVDLSLFQVMLGLEYAFPRALAKLARRTRRLRALRDAVAEQPRIAAYLVSDRRLPFNEDDLFRHYPELDAR
jgi:glutathione S-transferase